jgi:hypothetical protein
MTQRTTYNVGHPTDRYSDRPTATVTSLGSVLGLARTARSFQSPHDGAETLGSRAIVYPSDNERS